MEIINPLEFPGWDDRMQSHSSASFFHTTSWARVLHESYGYKPKYFTVIENDAVKTMIPVMEIDSILTGKRGVSLPFSDYSDIIAEDGEQYRIAVENILDCGKRFGWRTVELRGGECPWRNGSASSEFLGHRLDLNRSEAQLFSSLRTNMQRNIKKALNLGVEVSFRDSAEAVKDFYRLNCITRKGHGIPPQPVYFFRKIHEHVLSRGSGIIVSASFKGEIVSGCIFFHFGNKVIYKYGASTQEGKTCRANNLVMWEAIKWYRRNGYLEFCFGRTEKVNTGLRDYKLGYGTEEHVISYYKYDIGRNEIVSGNDFATAALGRVYKYVPIPLSRIVGNLLYKHIG